MIHLFIEQLFIEHLVSAGERARTRGTELDNARSLLSLVHDMGRWKGGTAVGGDCDKEETQQKENNLG